MGTKKLTDGERLDLAIAALKSIQINGRLVHGDLSGHHLAMVNITCEKALEKIK